MVQPSLSQPTKSARFFRRSLSSINFEEFRLSATQIRRRTSAYFISAALILIPVAILLDRYGPRRVLVGQLIVTALGALVFAAGPRATTLILGRALIGLRVAGCLTTALKAVTVWFPRERWASGNSMVRAVGSLGVIAGTQPLQWLLQLVTGRDVFWIGAIASLIMAMELCPNLGDAA